MSKTTIKAPSESPEELALQKEQVALLREQRDVLSEQIRQQQLLAPILFKSAGIEPIMDEAGRITGFRQMPDELKPLREKIEQGFLERTEKALAGQLPVDPLLERELGTQEATLREALRKQLGPGFELSTPGMEALRKFGESRFGILEGSRRGELSLAESLGLAREQSNEARLNSFLSRVAGVNQFGQQSGLRLGEAAAGFNLPLANMFRNRQLQFQGRALTGQLDAQRLASLLGAGGDVAGAIAMGVAASSAKLKKDIEPLDRDEYRKALRKLRETPVTRWRYKWEPEDREPHIGPILELSPQEIRADATRISLLDYAGLTHAAVKGLDKDVRSLREQLNRRRRRH